MLLPLIISFNQSWIARPKITPSIPTPAKAELTSIPFICSNTKVVTSINMYLIKLLINFKYVFPLLPVNTLKLFFFSPFPNTYEIILYNKMLTVITTIEFSICVFNISLKNIL